MNVMLGLANGNIPTDPSAFTPQLVASWEAQGIRCLAVAFAQPYGDVPSSTWHDLRHMLADGGVAISQFTGVNANLVHSDVQVREQGLRRVADAIPAAEALGATMIASGCGTNHPNWAEHFYGPAPLNHAPETEDRLVESLRHVADLIADSNLLYAIECHQLSTMRSPEVIRDVLDRVDSAQIVANFDPVNLLDSANAAYTNGDRIRHMIRTVGPRYGPSCHVKDLAVGTGFICHLDEVAPGEGLLDFGALFEAVLALPGPTALIVEHLPAGRTDAAVAFVRNAARDHGLELV
jgi:sugar phosphate isomerase/epimerase